MVDEGNITNDRSIGSSKSDKVKVSLTAISHVIGLGILADKVKQVVRKGEGYTFDESYQEGQHQLKEVDRISDNAKNRFVALPQHIIDHLKNNYSNKKDEINNLEKLWSEKIKAIDEAIARKILEEREEEERRILKKQSEQILIVAEKVNNNIEEEKKENADSLKYRIFASLIFSGILDVTDILECVINIFGINEEFAKAVGEVVANKEVMSFIGDINKAFGIDKFIEQVSRVPILNDINQTALDISKTDAFQAFSPLALEVFTGDLAEHAIRAMSFFQTVVGERGLQINHEKRSEENDKEIRALEEMTREESKPDASRIASRVIEVETRLRLDEIYMRNYLKSVCEGSEVINGSDKSKLNHFKIRDENKQECGTLFEKIEEAKSENNAEEKLNKIKKILELVVGDKDRQNMDVLESFREVARGRFYRAEVSDDKIQPQREKYLKEEVLKGLDEAGNEYKKEAAQEVLKEVMKTQYAGNDSYIEKKNKEISDLATSDAFADFIKKEFLGCKQFDDIVTKIAISVKKDEIAQTVVRSPYHRVIPAPEVGSDSVGRGRSFSATQVATGTATGPATATATGPGPGPGASL